jgi:hypothetical protein
MKKISMKTVAIFVLGFAVFPVISLAVAVIVGTTGDISQGFFAVEAGNPTHYFWSVFAGSWGTLLGGLTAMLLMQGLFGAEESR